MLFGLMVLSLAFVGLLLLFLNRGTPKLERWGFWGFQSMLAIMTVAPGMLITRRFPRHPIGWMLLLTGLFAALTGFSEEFARWAVYSQPEAIEAAVWVSGLLNWLWLPSYALTAIFVPLLFPNGRFLTPRWRIVAWLGTTWMVLGSVWMILLPAPLPNNVDLMNPFGIAALEGLYRSGLDPRTLIPLVGMFLMLAASASLVLRYRRSQDATVRHQVKWFAYAAVLIAFAGMVGQVPGVWADIVLILLVAALPTAIAIAILRYRLYEIDIIIDRTLVFGALTGVIVILYILILGAVGMLVQNRANQIAALIAVVLVAILFHPLRTRLQRGVNRLLYGARDTPLEVLSALGQHMESAAAPEEMLPALAETVAKALKLPYVAVGLYSDEGLTTAAEYGKPTQEVKAFPLTFRGATVGQLLVAPRQPGDAFSQSDIDLLENIARQAGAAAHAVRLTADLRRSRQRLVTAREEERRRLRRDLHDGLGPHLASMTLTIDAIARLLDTNPEAAADMLQKLKGQSQVAVQEIRRLVYNLRPPALDDLGLTEALRESAARYSQSGMRIIIDAPDPMPSLPAAVEVAAYRIAQEGMTNALRHANASICRVTLTPQDDHLCVTIEDNGRGLPKDLHMGVGLRSIQERVAELEGRFSLGTGSAGGALVRAWLPIMEAS